MFIFERRASRLCTASMKATPPPLTTASASLARPLIANELLSIDEAPRHSATTELLGFSAKVDPCDEGDLRPRAMEERRKHQRIEINEPAYVSAGGSVMSCVVRNISPEGAAIDVDNPAFVPARFRLVMANGATVHDCNVAWIQKNRIGLTFIAAQRG
jgi:hypothetical protein